MCKQHLNAFSVMARSLEYFSLGQRASNVTGFLVDPTLQPAERRLWAALRLQRAATAVAHGGPIKKCLAVVDQPARRREGLAGWAGVQTDVCCRSFKQCCEKGTRGRSRRPNSDVLARERERVGRLCVPAPRSAFSPVTWRG